MKDSDRNFICVIVATLLCTGVLAQPTEFRLYQNEPNPFTATGTEIRYDLALLCFTKLWVEDVDGNQVKRLVDAQYLPGSYLVRWDARDESGRLVSSGTYIAKILSTTNSDTLYSDSISMQAQTDPFPPNIAEIKLVPDDIVASFYFGRSVAMSGDVLVVGARYYDDNVDGTGSAYVYRWIEGGWRLEAKLIPSDRRQNDSFGSSVSISGNLILVGAPADIHRHEGPGTVYIYRYQGTSWMEEAKLTAENQSEINSFGYAVSISGDMAVVGDPERLFAHMFHYNGSSWVEASAFGSADRGFGFSVDVDGNFAVVGAWGANDDVGAAQVFRYSGMSWTLEERLTTGMGSGGDWFGRAVAVDKDVILIGAPYEDVSVVNSGAAYVYRFNESKWHEETKLSFEGTSIYYFYFGGFFGSSVSLDGDMAVIGVPFDDDNGDESGSVFVYRWDGNTWMEIGKIRASDAAAGDRFGESVCVSGNRVLVGSPFDDDSTPSGGAAYVYDLSQVTSVKNESREATVPTAFNLSQNYPNPFNPTTTIRYEIPEASIVQIKIYNQLGQLVHELVNERKPTGVHEIVWNGRNDANQVVPSGIYYYTLKAGEETLISSRMIMLR